MFAMLKNPNPSYILFLTMDLKQTSITVIGNFNPRIFTPLWVQENLFEKNEIVQGMINFDDMDFAFKYKNIIIIPKYHSLEIVLEGYTEKGVQKITHILLKILELLPQTPIKTIGINFRYSFMKNENYKILDTLIQHNCNLDGYELSQIKHSQKRENYSLNIISTVEKDLVKLVFNYHYIKTVPTNYHLIKEHYLETKTIIK